MKIFKTLIPAVLAAALMAACSTSGSNGIQTGDLVFVGLPMDYQADSTSMGSAIVDATGGKEVNMIHAAILEVQGDGIWIIDATTERGVARYPLADFLADFTLPDGGYPVFQVKRLVDNSNAAGYVENAKRFIGQQYDNAFLPSNGAMYCTELVHDSYIGEDGCSLFHEVPMNFRNEDGEFPAYWVQLFAGLGMPIPQDVPGTNPQEMAAETVLIPVEVDITACI